MSIFKQYPRFLFVLAVILCLLFVTKMLYLNSFSPDSYLHMGIGQYIVTNKKIPTHADVSFKTAAPSIEFIAHSWASDVLLYLTGSVHEVFSLIFLLIPFLAITLLLLKKIFELLKIPWVSQLILLATSLFLSISFWKLNSLILLVPLLVFIVYMYLKWKLTKSKLILLCPVILVLVANISGGFIFIPIIFITFIMLFEFATYLASLVMGGKYQGNLWLFLPSLALSIPIGFLLNPSGLRIGLYVLTFLGVMDIKRWSGSLPEMLTILNQNFVKETTSSFVLISFAFYILFTICTFIIISIKSKRFFTSHIFILPLFLFFILGISWIRFIPISVFTTMPILAVILKEILHEKKLFSSYITYTVLIFIFLILTIFTPRIFDFTPPENATNILLSNSLKPNTLTSFEFSGYVFFKNFPHKGFIDSRDDLYDESEMINIYAETMPLSYDTLEPVLSENDASSALVSRDSGTSIASALNQSTKWSLMYFDKNAYVFAETSTLTPEIIKNYTLKYLDLNRGTGFDPEESKSAIKEMKKFIQKYPQNYFAIGQLASMYRITGQLGNAENLLNSVPDNSQDFLYFIEMGRLRAAQGFCKSSKAWYDKALERRSEKLYSRAILDLAVLYAGCFRDLNRAKHYFTRYNSFLLSSQEKAKMKKIMDDFNIRLDE